MFDCLVTNGVGRLALARPEARNAIPAQSWSRLADEAELAVTEGARILLVSGRGSAFCAGADLSDFGRLRDDGEARTRFREAMGDALDRLARLPVPTIALIEGACYGAGVALAMACDLRLASPAARFGITPAKLGISYPQSDIARLVRLVGPGQASRLLFTAGTIDAAEAARIGLVELVVEEVEQAGVQVTETMLANSGASLAALKRGIGLAACGVAQDDEQDRRFDDLFGSTELGQRLAAIRPPR